MSDDHPVGASPAGYGRHVLGRRLLPVVLLATLVGCGGAAPGGPAPDGGPATVIVPGGPGEVAQVLPVDEARERMTPQPVSPADVAFVSGMIPHHEQALTMAALAPERAADPQVRAIAERITAAQGPEILALQGWLDAQEAAGRLVGQAGGHGGGHGSGHAGGQHPGMATPAQLDELAAASGAEFDRLFLRLMITHHEGALRMADDQRRGGSDVLASQMADDVTSGQSTEIERMRGLLGA